MQMTDFFDDYGPSFLGLQLYKLLNEIDRGGTASLANTADALPSKLSSTLIYLHHCGPCPVSELSAQLRMSHQLVGQRLNGLRKRRMIEETDDPDDGRKKLIGLNKAGKKAAKELEAVAAIAETVYQELFKEIGIDVFEGVTRARRALEIYPLHARILHAQQPRTKRGAA